MIEYPKIQTVYRRDPETKYRTLLEGDYAWPEFAYLAANEWVFTEKVDGTNIRIEIGPSGIVYGGRTSRASIPAPLIKSLDRHFRTDSTEKRLQEDFKDGGTLFGEGYGAKIQKGGGNYRSDQGFVLFDVLVGSWWLKRSDIEIVAEGLGIDVVPVVGTGTLSEMVEKAKEGFFSTWGPFAAEGIVARPAVDLRTRAGERVITKIKTRDFQ